MRQKGKEEGGEVALGYVLLQSSKGLNCEKGVFHHL